MSLHDHNRFKVVSETQHLLEHSLADLGYSHAALPSTVLDAESALDYVFNVLYPRIKDPVALFADLPTGVDTPNLGDLTPTEWDQRVVQDDGDGKAAIYMFFKKDGQVAAQWNKIADLDFGTNSVIQGLMDQTQYLFFRKYGSTDYDQLTELPLLGKDAGQHVYGGDSANQNLTLHATNGDDPGIHTGYVQVDDNFRPYSDLEFDLGTPTEKWNNFYAGTAYIGTGTMTITSSALTGSITDSSGVITFDDENLLTTGNINGNTITASTSFVIDTGVETLTLTEGSIVSSTAALDFGDNALSTTGTLTSGVATIDTTLVLSTGSITDTSGTIDFGSTDIATTGDLTTVNINLLHDNLDLPEVNLFKSGNLVVGANIAIDGSDNLAITMPNSGSISINTAADWTYFTGLGINVDGIVDATSVYADDARLGNIYIDGDRIYNNAGSVIYVGDTLAPEANNSYALGNALNAWTGLFLSSDTASIQGPSTSINMTALNAMNRNIYRDIAMTTPAEDGDALFYNAASGRWLASVPDTEIDHTQLLASSLTTGDAGHTQFAMLAGRAGGQTIYGGTGLGELLSLGATTDGSNLIQFNGFSLRPEVAATGQISLGAPATEWNDLFMSGELIGSRLENTSNPSSLFNSADVGRPAFNTADGFIYINDGTEFKRVGNNSYNATHTNVELQTPIDVSASVEDARNCIWQLCDVSSNEEVMNVPLQKTATTVIIANTVPLPAGSYRLIGIQV